MANVSYIFVRWEAVAGASGYEISVNGQVTSSTGPNAKTSKVAVSAAHTLVEIVDLPTRSRVQALDFLQAAVP